MTVTDTRIDAHNLRVAARPLDAPTAAPAVMLLFCANGLAIGAYAGSLPALREKLSLTPTLIAVLLFCGGLAAILGMQLSGRLADSMGARRVCLASVPFLGLGLLTVAYAPTFPIAAAGGALLGFGNGAIDVAMNALGVHVEKVRTKPIMSLFHGLWSIGNLTGAATVMPLAWALGLSGGGVVAPLGTLVTAVLVGAWFAAWRLTPETPLVHHVHADGTRTKVPRAAWWLGLMAIGFGLGEGTAAEWSSLHVTDVAGVPATVGSAGLIAMSSFMVVIRLLGDRLVSRYGRRAVVRGGGVFAMLGYLLVASVTPLPLLLLGWAMVGFGVGMIAPQVYAVAGHMAGGRGLAVVVTFGYASFLSGPAIIGSLVNAFGIAHTMYFPAALCAAILLMAKVLPRGGTDRTASE